MNLIILQSYPACCMLCNLLITSASGKFYHRCDSNLDLERNQDHVVTVRVQRPDVTTWVKGEFNYSLVFIMSIAFYAILLSQVQVIHHITSLVKTLCYKPRWFDSLYYERCLVIWSQALVITHIIRFVIWCVFRYQL